MARGNQRDKAREKNLKEQAAKVYYSGTSRDVSKKLLRLTFFA